MANDAVFPFLWKAPSALFTLDDGLEYLGVRREEIRRTVEDASAILFRGFLLRKPSDFGRAAAAAGIDVLDYQEIGGGGVRTATASPAVYTTIDDIAPDARQSPHHERARSAEFAAIPARLAFYCERPAAAGGETALSRSASVARRLKERHPELHAKLSANRLRYCKIFLDVQNAPVGVCPVCRQSHRSWQAKYATTSKDKAMERASRNGVSVEFHGDDLVRRGGLTVFRAISTPDVARGRTICWTHKMNERPCNEWVEYEDGTHMTFDEQECVRRAAIACETRVVWQAGDFLLIDNFTVQHSKCPHRGARRVYVTMGS